MSDTGDDSDADKVIDRLAARFPALTREHIAEIVQEEESRLGDAKVRDFVHVLVEREATDRLRLEAPPEAPPGPEPEDVRATVKPVRLDPMEAQRRSETPDGPLLGNYGGV